MNYDDYTEADYAADRAAGHLDAWEHASPDCYDALDQLIQEMQIDLLIQVALYADLANALMLNTIHQGDCLELMQHLPAGSVDMILCDLPYGTTACKWDTIIPFDKLWAQYERVIKPSGAIVLTASQPFSTLLIASNLALFKYSMVWKKSKGSGFLNAKNAPIKMHEDIAVFSKGATANCSPRRMAYNPQGLEKVNRIRKQPVQPDTVGNRPSRSAASYKQEYQGYPSTVLHYPNDGSKLHPTQKPVALFEYLIRTYTNPGDVVLDNCAGSGTTAVAAENTGRRWICMEQEEKYVTIARARVAALYAAPADAPAL